MKKLYNGLRVSLIALLLTGSLSVSAQATYKNGVFVLNEGGFGSTDSSVSFLSNDFGVAAQNGIYATVNPTQEALGATGQSIAFNGDYAYIVMNVSHTIKIVNRETFEYVATISTGVQNPRYIAFAAGKGYVTDWGDSASNTDDYVGVINLTTNTIESSIPVSGGVEKILESNGKLYVAHKGGYGFGNLLSVIDPVTSTVTATITVGDLPESMIVKDNYLYVLGSGIPAYAITYGFAETFGKLVKIDLTDNTIASTVEFPAQHPSNLRAGAGAAIYYSVDTAIYKTTTSEATVPVAPLFTVQEPGAYGIYGMEVIDDKIYVGDAGDYTLAGHAYVYSLSGILLESHVVGVAPNGFYKADALLFEPEGGATGSTAVIKDSPLYVGWATGITVERGFVKKSDPNLVVSGSNKASSGTPEDALGFPDGNIVSLGDEGNAVLTFASPIYDGEGFDFAVFENGFTGFLELAFVEVSSDGVNFFRFPTHSLTTRATQVGSFGSPVVTNLYNFAGKYTSQYGTPFDISELPDNALLDKNSITHVRVVDVVGSIDPLYATFDSFGNVVNDPYPTPFASSGFDLQAVGVFHQLTLGIDTPVGQQQVSLYPNPAKGRVYVRASADAAVKIIDASGRTVINSVRNSSEGIDVSSLSSGVYFTVITSENRSNTLRLVIE